MPAASDPAAAAGGAEAAAEADGGDGWIPATPGRRGGEVGNASTTNTDANTVTDANTAGNPDAQTPPRPAGDGDGDDAGGAASASVFDAGSVRRRLSDLPRPPLPPPTTTTTTTNSGRGEHPPARPPSGRSTAVATNPNANHPDASHASHADAGTNATIDPAAVTNASADSSNPLLSALLFLTKTSLSTTASLLQPPLQMTTAVLLPSLYCALADLLSATTPTRVQDWVVIFTASVKHLFGVVVQSRGGERLRGNVGRVGGGVVDVAATPAFRGLLIEGTATALSLAEALHTPEFRSLLGHGTALGCRLVDAASTGAAKDLMADVAEMVWGWIELGVAEETVVGVSECCAYLCHALEMEHGVYRRGARGGGGDGRRPPFVDGVDDAASAGTARAEAARRRRERARWNARAYGSGGDGTGSTLDGDGEVETMGGIEEAILDSLGGADRIYGRQHEQEREQRHGQGGDGDGSSLASLPSRVVVESPTAELGDGLEPPSSAYKSGGAGAKGDDHDRHDACSSIGSDGGGDGDQHNNDDDDDNHQNGNSSFAREACDVEFLRRRIAQRSRAMGEAQMRDRNRARRQGGTAGEDGPVVDIEEASATTNVSEFYRLVEQVSAERQAEAVSSILGREGEEEDSRRQFYPRAAAAAGAGNEHGQDTLRSRLEAYASRRSRERAGIGVGGQAPVRGRGRGGISVLSWMLLLWFLLGCAVVGGFSCYGVYVFVFAPAAPPTMASLPLLKNMVGAAGTKPSSSTATPSLQATAPTEIVVKIVHVTPDGSVYNPNLSTTGSGSKLDTTELEEKIAEAAVSAMQNAVAESNNHNTEL